MKWIQRRNRSAEKICKPCNTGRPAGWTLIDVGIIFCDGFSVVATTRISAFRALSLRQQIVNLIDNGSDHEEKWLRK